MWKNDPCFFCAHTLIHSILLLIHPIPNFQSPKPLIFPLISEPYPFARCLPIQRHVVGERPERNRILTGESWSNLPLRMKEGERPQELVFFPGNEEKNRVLFRRLFEPKHFFAFVPILLQFFFKCNEAHYYISWTIKSLNPVHI